MPNNDEHEDIDDVEIDTTPDEDVEEDEDEEEESDENDNKPLTAKDLKDFRESFKNDMKKEIDGRFKNSRNDRPKPYQPNRKDTGKDDKPEIESRLDVIERNDRIKDFAADNGLTIKEAKYVFTLIPNATKKTLRDPFIQGGLEKLRQNNSISENIPAGSSARTFKVAGKSWEELSSAEKKENFSARQQAILASQRK